ncbi:gluconeogenesis factor YvcK family protein [Alkalithermobacter paradoxus]|uniref:Putative gluconeogenesis factor n=1 Tax=Alkalithermobacter paradoxus TaxID=29349 RepID=A0A1V4I4U3_9FIRM|nr:gluconeogenesis factor [[Clostridium] thermoalcaliphilum]
MDNLSIIKDIALIICLIVIIYTSNQNIKAKRIIQRLKAGPKVVVIGGGTGQSIFLRGLKKFTDNITAIVTVSDDGGGSGVLREDLGMLPPGDIRNCILALADIEPTMEKIMQYRFTEGSLKGQSFGNLFLAAMNGIYGNFEVAVSKISEIFAVKGKVLPVTTEDIQLCAKLRNGNIICGESNIPKETKNQKSKIEKVFLDPESPKALDDVIVSIKNADIIVIGPGSLYTSVIPNLLVDGVVDALYSARSLKIYVSNIMTQPGESDDYNVYDHAKAIIDHTKKGIIDIVIANTQKIPDDILTKYEEEGSKQVLLDKNQVKKLNSMGIEVLEDGLVEVRSNYVRHDAEKIASIVTALALRE